jgi:hypothetical protein
MYNFATSEDFKVKYMGVNNMNAPFSGIPYMHLDIEWLRSIFQLNQFHNDYVPRNCPTNKDDCFGQAFGSVLDPYRNIWTENQKDTIMLCTPSQSSALSLSMILYENSTLLPTRT